MLDVLILEDNENISTYMEVALRRRAPGLQYRICSSGNELKEVICSGIYASVYVLDDEVPRSKGERAAFRFIENCTFLLDHSPDARVLYTAPRPSDETSGFCRKKGIAEVDKIQMVDHILRYLKVDR